LGTAYNCPSLPSEQTVARTPCEALCGFQTDTSIWEASGTAKPLVQVDTVQGWCKACRGNTRLCVANFIAYKIRARIFLPLFVSVVQNAFQLINLLAWQPALSV